MEIAILKEDKDTLEFELKGEGHTICNLLRKQLWEDNDVAAASYTIKHPQTASPVFTLKTKTGKPRKHLQEALTNLKRTTKELRNQLQKL